MLTEKRVRDAKPEAKTRILWDSHVKGYRAPDNTGGIEVIHLITVLRVAHDGQPSLAY